MVAYTGIEIWHRNQLVPLPNHNFKFLVIIMLVIKWYKTQVCDAEIFNLGLWAKLWSQRCEFTYLYTGPIYFNNSLLYNYYFSLIELKSLHTYTKYAFNNWTWG